MKQEFTLTQKLDAGSAAFGAIGDVARAINARNIARYEAGLAGINARLAALAAQSVLEQGRKEAQFVKIKGAGVKAQQRTAYAKAGVDVSSGTAATTQAATDFITESDAEAVRANAARSAFGYRTQQTSSTLEQNSLLSEARAISPGAAGASGLLTRAGIYADKWYARKKVGAE